MFTKYLSAALLALPLSAITCKAGEHERPDYPAEAAPHKISAAQQSASSHPAANRSRLTVNLIGVIAGYLDNARDLAQAALVNKNWHKGIFQGAETLDLQHRANATPAQFNVFLAKFKNLHTLEICGIGNGIDLSPLEGHDRLTELCFDECDLRQSLAGLPSLPQLRRLSFIECSLGDALDYGFFPKVAPIESLAMKGCVNLSAGWRWELAALRNLKALVLETDEQSAKLQPAGFQAIAASLRGLESLDLTCQTLLTDTDLANLVANLPNLQALTLDGTGMVSDRGGACLANLTKLAKLSIGHKYEPVDISVQAALTVKSLRALNIYGSSFNDTTAALILQHEKLAALVVDNAEDYVDHNISDANKEALDNKFHCYT